MAELMEKRQYLTMQDMLNAYYPHTSGIRTKAGITTATPNYRNTIYGTTVFNALVYADELLTGILPKNPWDHSGFRIRTRRTKQSPGIAEGAPLPDPDIPEIVQVKIRGKEMVKTAKITRLAYDTEASDDNVRWAEASDDARQAYLDDINSAMLADAEAGLAGNNPESIDRIIASHEELTTHGITANYLDIYGIDRDAAASWADSYVDCAADARALDLDMLGHAVTKCKPHWANKSKDGKVWVTGYDTVERIEQLLELKHHYVNSIEVKISLGGLSVEGVNAGIEVSTYKKIPIVGVGSVAQPEGELARIYLMDTDRIGFSVISPTEYIESNDPIVLKEYSRLGAYYTSGEIIATGFGGHGKIRDIAVEDAAPTA